MSCVTELNYCILVSMYVYRQRDGRRPLTLLSVGVLAAVAVLVAAFLVVTTQGQQVRNVAQPSDYINSDLAAKPQGVDVSKWQHPSPNSIDWKTAAEGGKEFTFIKATEGTSPGNEHLDNDVEGARAAGMHIGLYHKARPAMDATAQADAFAEAVLDVGGEQLPPVLDFELEEGKNAEQLATWVQEFMDRLEDKTGRTPIMYTYKSFWMVQMENTKKFSEYPLWLAEYRQQEPTEPQIGGWDSFTFWQYAGNDGKADGFPTPVDLNVFNGSKSELDQMVGPVGSGAQDTPAPSGGAQSGDSESESGESESGTDGTATEESDTEESDSDSGSGDKPLTLTIPKLPIPEGSLPAGVTLPIKIVLPSSLFGVGSSGVSSDVDWLKSLLGGLPEEVLKSVEIS